MEEVRIIVATDFTQTPGGRWIKLGPFSGELFFKDWLLPKYAEARSIGSILHIYLDGVRSYPSSFLDQSFGELYRQQGDDVKTRLVFHAEEKAWVIDYIKTEIWNE